MASATAAAAAFALRVPLSANAWLADYLAATAYACSWRGLPASLVNRFQFGSLSWDASASGDAFVVLALPLSLPWDLNRSSSAPSSGGAHLVGNLSCSLTFRTYVQNGEGGGQVNGVGGPPLPPTQTILALDSMPVVVRRGVLPLFADAALIVPADALAAGVVPGIDENHTSWITSVAAPSLLAGNATPADWAGAIVPPGSNASALLAAVIAASTPISFAGGAGAFAITGNTMVTLFAPPGRAASFLPPPGVPYGGDATHPALSVRFGGVALPTLCAADGSSVSFVTPPTRAICLITVEANPTDPELAVSIAGVDDGDQLVKTLSNCPPPSLVISYVYTSSSGGEATVATANTDICIAQTIGDFGAAPALPVEGSLACPPACGDALVPPYAATSGAVPASPFASAGGVAHSDAVTASTPSSLASTTPPSSSSASSPSVVSSSSTDGLAPQLGGADFLWIATLGTGQASAASGRALAAVSAQNASSSSESALFASTGFLYIPPCAATNATAMLACADAGALTAPQAKCYWGQGSDCVLCPAGAQCPGGYRLRSAPGYYVSAETSLNYPTACPAPAGERCVGWNASVGTTACGVGYKPSTLLCLSCEKGYYSSFTTGGACRPCPTGGGISATVYIFSAFGIVAGVLVALTLTLATCVHCILARRVKVSFASSAGRAGAFLVILFGTLQLLVTVVKQANPATTVPFARPVMAALLTLQLQGVGPIPFACTNAAPLAAEAAAMAIGLGVAALWLLGAVVSHACDSKSIVVNSLAKLGGLAGTISLGFYAIVVSSALAAVRCSVKETTLWQYQSLHPNDGSTAAKALGISTEMALRTTNSRLLSRLFPLSVLDANPAIICYESFHTPYWNAGIATLALVAFLLPLLVFTIRSCWTLPILLHSSRLPAELLRLRAPHVFFDGIQLKGALEVMVAPFVAAASKRWREEHPGEALVEVGASATAATAAANTGGKESAVGVAPREGTSVSTPAAAAAQRGTYCARKSPPPIDWPLDMSDVSELDVWRSLVALQRRRNCCRCCDRTAEAASIAVEAAGAVGTAAGATDAADHPAAAIAARLLRRFRFVSSAKTSEKGFSITEALAVAVDAVGSESPQTIPLRLVPHFLEDGTSVLMWATPAEGSSSTATVVATGGAAPLTRAAFFADVPLCGCAGFCVRRYDSAAHASESFLDSSLALNAHLLTSSTVKAPTGLRSAAFASMAAFLVNEFRPSLGLFQLLLRFALVFANATTAVLHDASLPPNRQSLAWKGMNLASVLLGLTGAAATFIYAPFRAPKLWVQPIAAYTLLLAAAAQVNAYLGHTAVSRGGVLIAEAFSTFVAVLCIILPVVCVAAFLLPLYKIAEDAETARVEKEVEKKADVAGANAKRSKRRIAIHTPITVARVIQERLVLYSPAVAPPHPVEIRTSHNPLPVETPRGNETYVPFFSAGNSVSSQQQFRKRTEVISQGRVPFQDRRKELPRL